MSERGPLLNAQGQVDIPNGWAEDERNWAILTAATNRVLTAEQMTGTPVISRVVDPTLAGTTAIVRHLWVSETELEGKVTNTKIGVMQVWQKQGNDWKLLARSSYRLPEPTKPS